MPHYKDIDNKIHFLDSEEYEYLLPAGCIKITDDEADAIRRPTPTLAGAQTAAYAAIDSAAGITRSRYITDVAGQSETYLLKSGDANRYTAAGYPVADIAAYPMVRAEAKALYGATPTDAQYRLACDYIVKTQEVWLLLAADIEECRRRGKEAVRAITVEVDATDAQIVAAVLAINEVKQAAIAALEVL